MEQNKSLGGNINQDIAFIKHPEDVVYNSENFVITTDEGGTFAVRTNVKGNSQLLALPEIAYKTKISLNQANLGIAGYTPGVNYTTHFTINGTPFTFRFDFVSYEVMLEDLYQAILTSITDNTEWSSVVNAEYISAGVDSFIDLTSSISITVTEDSNLLTIINDYQTNISDLKIFGWVVIREDIYLLSTNGKFNPDAGESPTGSDYMQIWKLTYFKDGDYTDPLNYSISLLYNNILDTTIYRPIANPGMIIGRYENDETIKIYWTDNYNAPRFINIANPNAKYLTAAQLELFPKLNISEPRLKEIVQAGNILEGTYQAAYRLSKTKGGETVFSNLSNPIHVLASNDNITALVGSTKSQDPTNFIAGNASYQGSMSLGTTNKSLLYVIDNVDTNYDFIELCIVYRSKLSNVPDKIQIVKKEPITSTSIELLYTGNESVVNISLDELNVFTASINRVKSLATKNNYLFLSNVDVTTRVLNYDSRVYRFPKDSITTKVYDQFGTDIDVDDTYALDLKHDAIQDYTAQSPASDTNYLYQYNSDVVGGSGKNISYRFLSWDECKAAGIFIVLDDNLSQTDSSSSEDYTGLTNPTQTWNNAGVKSYYPPYRNVSRNSKVYSSSILGQEYYLNTSFESNISPYTSSLFKTPRRDEMYRYGIQFYDKRGNPYFAKWIADIRMPHIYMPDGAGGKALTYPLVQYENGALYAYPLILEFTVDTSSIDDLISGWQIVRTERKESDKHIVHQGVLNPSVENDGVDWFTRGNDPFSNGLKIGDYQFDGQLMFYFSPEVAFFKKAFIEEDDYVEIVGLMDNTKRFVASNDTHHDYTLSTTSTAYDYNALSFVVKNYEYVDDPGSEIPYSIYNTNAMNPLQIKTFKLFDESSNTSYRTGLSQVEFTFAGKSRVFNYGKDFRQANQLQCGGSRGLLLEIYDDGANYDFGSYRAGDREIEVSDGWAGTFTSTRVTDCAFKAYVANCKRNITGQYGGNSYAERANSEYISCSPVVTNSNTICVLQGDAFINVVDYMASSLNFGHDAPDDHYALTRFIPLETDINIDLRVGAECGEVFSDYIGLVNKEWNRGIGDEDLTGDLPGELIPNYGHIAKEEAFNYNTVYSNENNIRKYFAEPVVNLDSGKYDVRTYKTAQKTNGEGGESWSDVKELAYIEVDSSFGPINNTVLFRDRIYFFQDKGFGAFQIAEQRLTQTDSGENLILGSAGVLERFDYISTKTGTKHQFSFSISDYSMVWFDTLSRKIIRFKGDGPEPLSDIKGISAYLYNRLNGKIQTTDNPYIGEGVHATYDFRFNRHIMTFLHEEDQTRITVMYNESTDGFEGFLTCYPEVYINDKLNIFSIPYTSNTDQDYIYIQGLGNYGEFFNRTYPSKLSVIVNENPIIEKVLTNLEIVAEGYDNNTYVSPQYDPVAAINREDFFDVMRVWDTYQNTDFQGLSNLSRRHKTIWNVKVPSDRVKTVQSNIFDPTNLEVNRPAITKRMKDKWFGIDLVYNNTNNRKFVAQTLKAIYSINSR